MQAVFKVKLPASSELSKQKTFTSRKAHKKSRGGCLACKKRRVKCDEARPRCTRCLKIKEECTYAGGRPTFRKTLFEDEADPVDHPAVATKTIERENEQFYSSGLTSGMYSMSVDLLNSELDLLLTPTGSTSNLSATTGNIRLLQHFQTITYETLGGPRFTKVFQSSVRDKAFGLPYLMHMALAVSCAHLKRLCELSPSSALQRRYALAEAAHWQSGLQLYRKALAESTHDFDGIINATFLSIIFTFALDDDIPQDSYATEDPEKLTHAINPLAATGGFRVVRSILGERMLDSVWRAVLADSDDQNGTFSSDRLGIAGLPTAFVDLCELTADSNSENNRYHTIVSLLAPLLRLKPKARNFTKLIAYSGRTWQHFRPLLFQRDPRALLLISYWFALLRQVDQWWIATRARTECLAIVRYLCQTEDPRIAALLPFPASLGTADISYIW